jgi:hypothetical protein
MLKVLKQQSGSTIILALIIMTVLMVLGASLITISMAENKFSIKHEDKIQAHYIARSGAQAIAEYMMSDPGNASNIIGKSSEANLQVGNGQFIVSVEEDEVNNVINITSVGEYNGTQQTVKIQMSRSSEGIGGIFQYAIVAKNNMGLSSGNGNQTNITGSVAVKNGTINIGQASASGETMVDSDLIFPPIIHPPDQDPAIPFDSIYGIINSNETIPTTTGTPKYISVGSIDLKNASINISGDGVVHMYVDGNINLETNARFNVSTNAKLYIYVTGNRTIKLTGNGTQSNVFIYAPDSDITWNNAQPNGDFYGALIGNNVYLQNQLTIRHNPDMVNDVNIDKTGTGISFTGYKWIE